MRQRQQAVKKTRIGSGETISPFERESADWVENRESRLGREPGVEGDSSAPTPSFRVETGNDGTRRPAATEKTPRKC
jgi:hypothetical protein